MIKRVYGKEEFLEKTKIGEARLDAFVKAGILKPAGKVDGSTPYFDDHGADAVEAILKLLEMGYTTEEVIRIRRKVGLPKKGEGKGAPESEPLLTVGELARRTGSNPRTIKHWEEKGIIEPDSHSPGGFRLYREAFAQVCLLVLDLQNFGYSLDEIKELADLYRDLVAIRKDPALFPAARVKEKVALMAERLAALGLKLDALEKGSKRWRAILRQREKELSAIAAETEKALRREKKARGDESRQAAAAPPTGEPGPA